MRSEWLRYYVFMVLGGLAMTTVYLIARYMKINDPLMSAILPASPFPAAFRLSSLVLVVGWHFGPIA